MATDVLQFGREILHDEARALDALADSLDGPFEAAVALILACRGKLIVSGLGKSGHVARKIAATFASTGTTATFLHLAEAMHGDLGMAAAGDIAILISQSGETAELEPVIDHFRHVGIPVIAITGNSASMLAHAAAATCSDYVVITTLDNPREEIASLSCSGEVKTLPYVAPGQYRACDSSQHCTTITVAPSPPTQNLEITLGK